MGGDWYDALALPGGELTLVIGDVEGHGLSSATFMSQLRNAVRAYVIEDSSPASALDRLRRLAEAIGEEWLATVLCVTVAPGGREARFALPPGSTLLLYTDGLVERRDADLDDQLHRLSSAAEAGPSDINQLVDHLLAEVAHDRSDDVALLALRVDPVAGTDDL